MLRPPDFLHPYLTTRHTPYQIVTALPEIAECSASGGVMKSGKILWTQQKLAPSGKSALVLAFSEEIGTITVDPRVLRLADAPFN